MLRFIKRLQIDSLRFKLPAVLFIIIFPFTAFLFGLSMYAVDVVKDQVAQSSRNMTKLYLDQIDNKLAELDQYILGMESLDNDLYQLNSNDDETYYMSQVRLINQITKDMKKYPSFNSIFAYVPDRNHYIDVYNNQEEEERNKVRDYVRQHLDVSASHPQGFITDGWFWERLGEDFYFFRIFNTNGVYFGTWINVERLTVPLNLIELGNDGYSLLVSDEGVPLIRTESLQGVHIDLSANFSHRNQLLLNKNYLVVGEQSTYSNVSLVVLIPEADILAKLPFLQKLVFYISIGVIIFVPISLVLLRYTVLRPLNRILMAMKKTRDGNIDVRIQPFQTSLEFKMLNSVFNEMMSQIQKLKIDVYEEQLNKQKAELKHMQLQLNPHFLMNSLNMIYSLSLTNKNVIIQEMVICLVDYLRYMLKSNSTFVTLKEELVHVENYLQIQELRFKDSLRYQIEVWEPLQSFHVPPLVIQTFVENTVKHAVTLEKQIHINIRIVIPDSDPSMMEFTISDNGHGFPVEIFEVFAAEKIYTDKHGREHIGIWNMRKRLKLLYGENAQMSIHNQAGGGALVRMSIPLREDMGSEN
jgi:two-component system sensor histidine kinase YesM